MKNLIITAVAMIMIASCANSQTQQKGSIEDVDSKRFKELVDAKKGIVLDVRTKEEVTEGYIQNAVHLDIYEDDFESKLKTLDKTKEVYVYCAGGGRSSDAAKMLQKMGFP